MRFVTLTQIVSDRSRGVADNPDLSDDPSENVHLLRPEEDRPMLVTHPVRINAECIRCFYPRKDNRQGTRITFSDGGGFAVTEPFDEVKALVDSY